jgi:monoamine oxidase
VLSRLGPGRDAALRAQLVRLFGPEAGAATALEVQDWAAEAETTVEADLAPPAGHPSYAPIPALESWAPGRVAFAGSELAPEEGGFLEGALAAADAAVVALARATAQGPERAPARGVS